jgi:intracellular sulfur oxidation DsrE/DsrF family protein
MEATDREPAELIEGVTYVQAGIAEIVERQLDGWVYVRP